MSYFNHLFGNNKEEKASAVAWRNLIDLGQLKEIDTLSYETPVLIFKHSTRCSISRFILKNFENEYHYSDKILCPYFLDLLNYRLISNEIANQYGVQHQSPQILIIKEGKCVFTETHERIEANQIQAFI